MDLSERRPVRLVPLPALAHQVVDLLLTVDWRAEQDLQQWKWILVTGIIQALAHYACQEG